MDKSILFPNLKIALYNVPKNFEIFGFTVALYGVVIAIGMLIGVSFILKEAKRVGLNDDKIFDITLITIVIGVIGARIYYVIFAWDSYKNNLLSIFNLREGGLAIYGCVLFGIVTVLILCKINKYNFLEVADVCIFGVIIGQIAGRWGNFFNREAFGEYTDGLFAMLIPKSDIYSSAALTDKMLDNLVVVGNTTYVSVSPTFLYESVWNLCVFLIMFIVSRHKKFHGQVFFLYLFGYGAGRFWIEALRTDQLHLWKSQLPVSRVLAAILVVIGVGLSVYHYKAHPLENEKNN